VAIEILKNKKEEEERKKARRKRSKYKIYTLWSVLGSFVFFDTETKNLHGMISLL